MRDQNVLLALVKILAPLSITAIGGASSIYAPLQHQTVDVQRWLSPSDFLDLFAISRVTPGPGSFLATLIGWKTDGLAGAAVATIAIFAPSCALCLLAAILWNGRLRPAWREALEKGLAPIGAGLMLAGVVSVTRLSKEGVLSWSLLIATAAILTLKPRIHPLLLLTAGGAVALLASTF